MTGTLWLAAEKPPSDCGGLVNEVAECTGLLPLAGIGALWAAAAAFAVVAVIVATTIRGVVGVRRLPVRTPRARPGPGDPDTTRRPHAAAAGAPPVAALAGPAPARGGPAGPRVGRPRRPRHLARPGRTAAPGRPAERGRAARPRHPTRRGRAGPPTAAIGPATDNAPGHPTGRTAGGLPRHPARRLAGHGAGGTPRPGHAAATRPAARS